MGWGWGWRKGEGRGQGGGYGIWGGRVRDDVEVGVMCSVGMQVDG